MSLQAFHGARMNIFNIRLTLFSLFFTVGFMAPSPHPLCSVGVNDQFPLDGLLNYSRNCQLEVTASTIYSEGGYSPHFQ